MPFSMEAVEASGPQFSLFKDCLVQRLIAKGGVLESASSDADDDLEDFALYLSSELWLSLPVKIREATFETRDDVPPIEPETIHTIVSPSFVDTLTSFGAPDADERAAVLVSKVIDDYLAEACAPPPVWSRTRTTECEICEREVPLTYHHLIPREVHAKVLKKKWHPESMLNSVAWLCRCAICS